MGHEYLTSTSEALLIHHGLSLGNGQAEALDQLVVLRLRKLLLKEVSLLQYCTSLRSCTLADNYITDIAALAACVHLRKLDVHGNQIQHLPGQEFWKPLRSLALLYLHNNPIRLVNNVESLSHCQSLAGLTLYDTPLSLQKSYRHMVVNSIWSLKALDDYVVSDEEIIEAWTLHGKFKSLSHDLHINLLPTHPSKDDCLQNEMKTVSETIGKINRILARCSPVLIIQKWIRGYLARRRMGVICHPEMQRKKLHYRRQGSLEEEREDGLRRNSPLLTFNHGTLPAIKQPVRGINGAADAQPVMRITVDLWKLQQDVRQVLPEAQVGYDPRKPGQAPAPVHGTDSLHEERRIKVPGLQAPEPDQQTDTEFSLFGRKAAVYQSDPSKDLLTGNEKSAEDIRRSVRQIHSMIQTNRERANVRKRQEKTTCSGEGRHFINLLPLCTVDRAYENRERYNSQMKKRSLVLQVHADRQQGRYKIEEFWEDRKNLAWYRNDIDAQTLAQHSESDLLDKSNSMDKVKHRHRYFCQQKEARQVDIARAKAFNTQHASVTKTLLRHDRMSRNRKEMQEKIANVQSMKENRERQKELIRCLQKQRQLDLQSENASEKVTLSSLVLLKANDRLQEAQTHVTAAKGQSVTAKPMYKVPVEQPVSKETRLKQEGT